MITPIQKISESYNFLSQSFYLLWSSSSYSSLSSNSSRLLRKDDNGILSTISEAIYNSQTEPLDSSLRRILPSLRARHVINLVNFNPHSLSPSSLFSLFNWLASRPPFRHTIQSYCTMAHFLCTHRMFPEALSLMRFLVSWKGKDSASLLFAYVLQTRGTHQSNIVFDVLIHAYLDSGFVVDAIQCFRLARTNNLQVPLHSWGDLLDKAMKLKSAESAWAFYLEIFYSGHPPKAYNFNALMHRFCKEGNIRGAQVVFDEMGKRRLRPTVVSFNPLINGYCKSRNLSEGLG